MPHPQRLHFYYVGAHYATEMFCRPMLGFADRIWRQGRWPVSTMDPAQVTCQACLKKMASIKEQPGKHAEENSR